MKKNNSSLFLLWKYINNCRSHIALLTLAYIGSTALFIFAPQALSRFIDGVQTGAAWSVTLIAILLYLAAILARTGMSAVLDVQLTSVGQRITDEYRRDIMAHYLSLDIQSLSGWTSGETITRLDEDVKGLFQYYYILFYKLAGSGLALIGILTALMRSSGLLSAALLLVSILSILGFRAIQKRGIPKYVRKSAVVAVFNGQMKEMLDNAVSLRALNAENFADTQMKKAMRECYKESFPAGLMYGNLWSASTIMQGIVVASGLMFALLLWDAGSIPIGMAYLIYTYSEMIIEPLQDFRNHMGNMQDAHARILRTQDLMDIPVKVRGGDKTLPGGPLELTIEGLSFAYTDGSDVLRDVRINVPPGGKLGIMGETGCGKSTLAGLIARLNAYSRGSIRLNGIELCDIEFKNFRERVAYCTQRIRLIHGTLRDNIVLFDTRYSDKDIIEAVQMLNLQEWFKKFSDGLDTMLSMGEGSLSSGEAQLVTLIRLALRKPGLMLLDEITAHLDAATERRIMHAVGMLCKNCTVVAIAHNGETLYWMDKIIRMENGVLITSAKEGAHNAIE